MLCCGGCTITSKAKINIFWTFFIISPPPSGLLHSKKIHKTLILAFEANNAFCPIKLHFFVDFFCDMWFHEFLALLLRIFCEKWFHEFFFSLFCALYLAVVPPFNWQSESDKQLHPSSEGIQGPAGKFLARASKLGIQTSCLMHKAPLSGSV